MPNQMMYVYSEQLRDKAKKIFSPLYGRDISDDEAEEFLASLANLTGALLGEEINY
jgi:hypothetical protein